MASEQSEIISDIHQGSVNPGHWPFVLERMASLVGARAAILQYHDYETKQTGEFHAFNYPPRVMREYIDHYSRFDPTIKLAAQRAPIGHAIADHQMAASRREFQALCGPEFSRFLHMNDNENICAAVLMRSEQHACAISFQRARSAGDWTDEELSALTDLTPYIQRSLLVHKEFKRLRARQGTIEAGIDKVYMGYVLFDRTLQVVHVNSIARCILERNKAISLRGSAMNAFFDDDTRSIRFGLQRAAQPHGESDQPVDYATTIGLRSPGSPPLPLLIIPVIHGGANPIGQFGKARVAVLFIDPSRNQPLIPETLRSAYGLTCVEAPIAIAVANGVDVPEIARMRGIMSDTVEAHLESIYSKLNISRRVEVAGAILNGPSQAAS